MRNVTTRGRDAIIAHEGFERFAYRDAKGLLTIGVGHLLTDDELASEVVRIGDRRVRWKDGLSRDDVAELLDQDLDIAERAVERLAPGLADNQFDALVSFVFNVGIDAFQKSTLLRCIREGRLSAVPEQMKRWNRAGGRVVGGLVRRREAEAALWASE